MILIVSMVWFQPAGGRVAVLATKSLELGDFKNALNVHQSDKYLSLVACHNKVGRAKAKLSRQSGTLSLSHYKL